MSSYGNALADIVMRDIYSFVLGREPESHEVATCRRCPVDLAISLLASSEFELRTAQPALAGCLGRDPGKILPPDVLYRVSSIFGLPEHAPDARTSLLAEAIETSPLSEPLRRHGLVWSAGALAAALRRADGVPKPTSDLESVRQSINTLSHGISVLGVSGVSNGKYEGQFRVETKSAHILLSLSSGGPAPQGDVCRLQFGIACRDRFAAETSLSLDFGTGLKEACEIELFPRGRTQYSAFVFSSKSLVSLRWNLGSISGLFSLAFLTARLFPFGDFYGRSFGAAALSPRKYQGWLLQAPAPPRRGGIADLSLSRFLTQELGGHGQKGSEKDYVRWLLENEVPDGRQTLCSDAVDSEQGVVQGLDLILIAQDDVGGLLMHTLESVRRQTNARWRLHIYFTGRQKALPAFAYTAMRNDRRVSCTLAHTDDVATALNLALACCADGWIGALEPGDVLRPDALQKVSFKIGTSSEATIVYADHDYIDAFGDRSAPVFKPSFARETLWGRNYLQGPVFIKAESVRAVEGWRSGYDGHEGYDLLLRLIERYPPETIHHVPEILAHKRPDNATKAPRSAVRAVRNHLSRLGVEADVVGLDGLGQRIVLRQPHPHKSVALVIPNRDKPDYLRRCVDSIFKTVSHQDLRIIIVENQSVEMKTLDLYEELKKNDRIRILIYGGPFNYSSINNFAVAHTNAEIVGLMNNDVEAVSSGWMEELVSWASQPFVGAVGAKLCFPNATIQHAGIVLGIGRVAAHSHKYMSKQSTGYNNRLAMAHNVSAVTGACLFVRRSLYEAVGGLDEDLAVAYNDVDFCLRLARAGHRTIFTPHAELIHHESVSRGLDSSADNVARLETEIKFMQKRWGDLLQNDPHYSPNLTKRHENFGFNLKEFSL